LLDVAVGGVDDESRAPEMVTDDPIRRAALDHVVGHVEARTVDEAGNDVTRSIEFGDGIELVLVEEPLS